MHRIISIILKVKTDLEVTYIVCSDQFPDVKNTFKVSFDGHSDLQFEETAKGVIGTSELPIEVQ